MSDISTDNAIKFWEKVHVKINRNDIIIDNWLDKFEDIIDKCNLPILDLGCGTGNDTLYLVKKNKKVVACDISQNAITNIKNNIPEVLLATRLDMKNGLPFTDNYFGIVISDLSLHYFTEKHTYQIINDIKRILSKEGYLFVRVNSVEDVNHGAGQGKEIEHHLYETNDKRIKRFFDEEDIKHFFKDFKIEYINEEIMTRYKLQKKLYVVSVKNNK